MSVIDTILQTYQQATGETAEVSLQTNVTPPIPLLAVSSNAVTQLLTKLIQPTIKVGSQTLYAPEGEASNGIGTAVFYVACGIGVFILYRAFGR